MKLVFLILAVFISVTTHAQVRVGNNGDGVEIGGKVYVLDLVERGAHLRPYFGAKFDIYLLSEILKTHKLVELKIDAKLLARKLNDLNKDRFGLGDFVFRALELYDINLGINFEPNPKPGSIFQLARRYMRSIEINAFEWQKMDSEQRVALLIHEGLYSLAIDNCEASSRCLSFDPKEIRAVVGEYFKFQRSSNVIDRDMLQKFNFEDMFRGCYQSPWILKILGGAIDDSDDGVQIEWFDRTKNESIQRFCSSGKISSRVNVEVFRSYMMLKFEPYQATFGHQLSTFVDLESNEASLSIDGLTRETCVQRLNDAVQTWIQTPAKKGAIEYFRVCR